jgi:hypothetical protein
MSQSSNGEALERLPRLANRIFAEHRYSIGVIPDGTRVAGGALATPAAPVVL